jgi:hypothetical protein
MSITGTITTTQIEVVTRSGSRICAWVFALSGAKLGKALIKCGLILPGVKPQVSPQPADGLKAVPFKAHFQSTLSKCT